MVEFGSLHQVTLFIIFALSALVIALVGWRLTRLADMIADFTGLGEAIMGAVLLGGATSLPGIATSVTAAWDGFPELAISNAIGGIAAQTAFLAVADIAYRKANLEHAAASEVNLISGMLLVTLLSITLVGVAVPDMTVFHFHPLSLLIIAAYLGGLRLASQTKERPMWKPLVTRETREDKASDRSFSRKRQVRIWLEFTLAGLTVAVAGYVVAKSGIAIVQKTGLSQTVVGALFTAVATSLPELITSVAAVRQGALTLAVGGIIGGNCFDVLFVAFSDFAYLPGSIYHALGSDQLFLISVTLLLTGILMLGLIRREKHGIANIGFESFLVIVVYLGSFALLMAR